MASPFTSTVSHIGAGVNFASGEPFSISQSGNSGPHGGAAGVLGFKTRESVATPSYGTGLDDVNKPCNYTLPMAIISNRAGAFETVGPNELLVVERTPTENTGTAFVCESLSAFNMKLATKEFRDEYGADPEYAKANKGKPPRRSKNAQKLLERYDIGRISQHTTIEDWQKQGDAQYIVTHQYRRAPLFNIWAVCYQTEARGDKGLKAVINENDYLWLIIKQFPFYSDTPGSPQDGWFLQIVPYVSSIPGAPSPAFYTTNLCDGDEEFTGAAKYVARVLETNTNEWDDREQHHTALAAVFPRTDQISYKSSLMQLSTIVVLLGVN